MGKLDDIMGLINRRKTAYDENNHEKCDFCYARINDLGQIQCSSCFAFLHEKILRFHLEKQYGEFWEEKYIELIKLQKRVRSDRMKEWPTEYGYINRHGDETTKLFYE